MKYAQATKSAVLTCGAFNTSATAVSNTLDRLGARYATFMIGSNVATATAATSAVSWASLKLQETDDTSGTWTDVDGFIGELTSANLGSTEFLIVGNTSTAVPAEYVFHVDLDSRKRYLRWLGQGGAHLTSAAIIATLSEVDNSPTNATAEGVAVRVVG